MTTTTTPQPKPQPDLPRLPKPTDPAPILPRHPAYAERVTNALLALGTTSPQITANLTRLGVVGRPGGDRGCAVYEYLLGLNLPVISINPMFARLIDGSRVDLPPVVGDWMAEYDAYAHPALVEAVTR